LLFELENLQITVKRSSLLLEHFHLMLQIINDLALSFTMRLLAYIRASVDTIGVDNGTFFLRFAVLHLSPLMLQLRGLCIVCARAVGIGGTQAWSSGLIGRQVDSKGSRLGPNMHIAVQNITVRNQLRGKFWQFEVCAASKPLPIVGLG
jgi:hypothetical protein